MKIRIHNSQDFYAGLMFIFFGVLFLLGARNYPMGSAVRMGPGYFPAVLGGLLTVIGFVISAGALRSGEESIKSWALRPMILVTIAVLGFAVLVNTAGLILAILALVILSCLAGSEFRLREVAGLSIVLAVLTVGVFVYGFGLPFKVWPK
jgi:hypothetical protein